MRRVSVFAGLLGYAVGVAADGGGHCGRLFDESRSLIRARDEAEGEQSRKQAGDRLVAAQLHAVTAYLNQCTDRKPVPDAKSPQLQKLVRLTALGCTERQAEMEWLDVDRDGSAELVLHGPTNSCDHVAMYEEGWSGVFFRDSASGIWIGQAIWPGKRTPEPVSGSEELFARYKPGVRILDFVDSEGASYMAVDSEFSGGDHTAKQLAVIRWLRGQPQEVLALSLSDWCTQPVTWNFRADGSVSIPAAEATSRCDVRAERIFPLFPKREAELLHAGGPPEQVPRSWLTEEQRIQSVALIQKILTAPGDDKQVSEVVARLNALPKPVRGNRKQARAENEAGLAAMQENRFGEARVRFGKALRADAGDVEIWNNLGYALIQNGDLKEAEMPLSAALILQPDRSSAWANLAMVYAKSGKVEESTAALITTYRFSRDRAKTGEFMKSLAERENDPALREAYRRFSEFAASGFPAEPAQRKFRYAPAVATLGGTLIRQTGMDADGRPETFSALQLDQPITVEAGEGGSPADETETGIGVLQVVPPLDPQSQEFLKKHQGERVVLSGTLFHSHSAHHHTKVLLEMRGQPAQKAEAKAAPMETAKNKPYVDDQKAVTRFGDLEIEREDDQEFRLTFNGKVIDEWPSGSFYTVSVETALPYGDKDYVLFFQNSGGIACPGTFLLYEVSVSGVKKGPDFGTCSDLLQARVKGGKLIVEMPNHIAHPELLGKKELRELESTKAVYVWDGQKLSESEAKRLPKDFPR